MGALIRTDGVLIASTIAIDDVGSRFLSSVVNIINALMKENEDNEKEIEIIVDNLYVTIIPLHNHFLCGILKEREEKKIIREYAERLSTSL